MGNMISPNLAMTENLAYILGVLKGDGYVTKGKSNYIIALAVVEPIFALSFKKALEKIGLNPNVFPVKGNGYSKRPLFKTQGYSKVFFEWYKILEDLPAIIPKEYMHSFIRGFYESDGGRYKERGYLKVAFYNKDMKLCKVVVAFLTELGFTPKFFVNGRGLGVIKLHRKAEVMCFFDVIKPCIKGVD